MVYNSFFHDAKNDNHANLWVDYHEKEQKNLLIRWKSRDYIAQKTTCVKPILQKLLTTCVYD